jgi:hypothetical protein
MIRQMFLDYAAPAVAAATLGVVGTFTLGHSERITVLETDNENSTEIQKELVRKVDNLTRIMVRVETKIEERERYEQRTR